MNYNTVIDWALDIHRACKMKYRGMIAEGKVIEVTMKLLSV
jgi:hypothetical protein